MSSPTSSPSPSPSPSLSPLSSELPFSFAEMLDLLPWFLKTGTKVPVARESLCTLRCYEKIMGMPIACKVEHHHRGAEGCGCASDDNEIVQRYLSDLYRRHASGGRFRAEDVRRVLQLVFHLVGDHLSKKSAGFKMPADIPDPRGDGRGVDIAAIAAAATRSNALEQPIVINDGETGGARVLYMPSLLSNRAEFFQSPQFLAAMGFPPNVEIAEVEENPDMEVPEDAIPAWFPPEFRDLILKKQY